MKDHRSSKAFSVPGKLFVATLVSVFLAGAITGTVSTYVILSTDPAEMFLLGQEEGTCSVTGTVDEVVDGDTILASVDGQVWTVRYLGVDAPESKAGEEVFYGKEAREKNQGLVGGKKIKIECEEKYREISRRALAYVYVEGVFVNAEMLQGGHATVYRRSGSQALSRHRLYDYFCNLEQEARARHLGLWNIEQKREWEQRHGVISGLEPVQYIADETHFHRPNCPKTEEIDFKFYYYSRTNALQDHKTPCLVCRP